jgi:glycosyltransferase involved in cell wall biosynthesis
MKIAFDDQIFGRQRYGGISRYISELVANLAQRPGVEPIVIAPFHVNRYLLRPDVRSHVRGLYLPFDVPYEEGIVKRLNALLVPVYWGTSQIDVVHETYYSQRSRGRARVRVLTIHDMIHEQYPQEFEDAAEIMAAKRAAADRADHVIFISETTRRDAMKVLGIGSERCSMIYMGRPLEQQDTLPQTITVDEPFILYVGQRGGYKNFRVLLEAFAQSLTLKNGFQLVAFGGGKFSREEQSEIDRYALGERVRQVTGNDATLNAYYRTATAFVYPSRYEGFGIPPLEAMVNGCPVVCSTGGSIPEVVGEAGCFFDADDGNRLSSLLERIAEDQDYARSLRAKGFTKAKSYSWSKCANETLLTYERLIGR